MYENRKQAFFSLTKKEFMDNVRSKWVLVVSLIFVGLILLVSAYQAVQPGVNGGFEPVVSFSSSIVVTLISIIAVVMGYKTIAEEVESKSIALLLTSELSRRDIIIGKFIGLTTVIAISVLAGLGIGGLVIGFTAGFENANVYGIYTLLAIMFGMAYLAISMMMSSIVSKTSTALAGGVFIWIFFNFIWDLFLFGILIATGWELPTTVEGITYPEWYHFARLFNPNGSFSLTISRVMDQAANIPEMMTVPLILLTLLAWLTVPLIIAMIWFNRKDL